MKPKRACTVELLSAVTFWSSSFDHEEAVDGDRMLKWSTRRARARHGRQCVPHRVVFTERRANLSRGSGPPASPRPRLTARA